MDQNVDDRQAHPGMELWLEIETREGGKGMNWGPGIRSTASSIVDSDGDNGYHEN